MEKKMMVLYPAAGIGHLIPMVELGKLFLRHGLSVTIIVLDFPSRDIKTTDSYISGVSAAHPSLFFHRLPTISFPSPPSNPFIATLDFLRLANPHFLAYLRSSAASILALILDFLNPFGLDVAADLSLPSYFFFTTSASNLAVFLHLPILFSQTTTSLKDLGDSPLHFPGLQRSIPASDIPTILAERNSEASKELIFCFERLHSAQGILVNSFQSLESPVFHAFAGRPKPQIYCIGPVTTGEVQDYGSGVDRHEALAWLDAQPSGRVVFLCFGSMGAFSEAQVREIAAGMESSGQRFLWVVRGPPSAGSTGELELWREPDLGELLPEGFAERTQGRGLVVKSWAPQVAVLRHEAVGGFVTHCGWNSVLEAIVAGVGLIAWPLYAEQRMNKSFLVEAGLAAEMRGGKEGWVTAAEVEERVRWLMETGEGKELRERVAAAGESARAALSEGGSSQAAMVDFVKSLISGVSGGKARIDG